MADPVSGELTSTLASCGVCRGWAEQDEGPYHREAPTGGDPALLDVGRAGDAYRAGICLVLPSGS